MRTVILLLLLLEMVFTWYPPYHLDRSDGLSPDFIVKSGRGRPLTPETENKPPSNYNGGWNRSPAPSFDGMFTRPMNDITHEYNYHVNSYGNHHNLNYPAGNSNTAARPYEPPNWQQNQGVGHGWNQNNQDRNVLGQNNQGGRGWNQPFRGK
ncbi:unnamed protein product [Caenorhabditis auriculariae]|uniref:Uncharacterized protein n=1 Tax=Caenorhabditis auriculariae TaxID=2777116 RepID=A0A8S1H3F8_9PELO|nr:unnamed protein product [Caenorhabditis auriculariae]